MPRRPTQPARRPRIRVLLAHDQRLVRAGLRSLLESEPAIRVVAEVGEGREALRSIEECRPQVALVHRALTDLNRLAALALVLKRCPTTHVVILGAHLGEAYVRLALRAGVRGYLTTHDCGAELLHAVRTVAQGESYLSPLILRQSLQGRWGQVAPQLATLTPRQREILHLLAEGSSTKEIAATLLLSPKTIEMHRRRIMRRLQIQEVTGLVRFAIQAGLVTVER